MASRDITFSLNFFLGYFGSLGCLLAAAWALIVGMTVSSSSGVYCWVSFSSCGVSTGSCLLPESLNLKFLREKHIDLR